MRRFRFIRLIYLICIISGLLFMISSMYEGDKFNVVLNVLSVLFLTKWLCED